MENLKNKKLANLDIRHEIEKSGFKYWEVAYKLNLNDGNFSRRLRRELSKGEKNEIRKAIIALKREEGEAKNNERQ